MLIYLGIWCKLTQDSNDTWYEITRVPKGDQPAENWVDFVLDEDMPLVRSLWQDLVEHTKPASTEFRFKAPWVDRSGVSGETWVLFSAYPEPYEDGSLKSVFGSMTNISSQKWAEGLQKKKMEEAVELKRQQENFIDITRQVCPTWLPWLANNSIVMR